MIQVELFLKPYNPFVFLLQYNFKNRGSLTFEPLTLVPIQTKMIDVNLLTEKEVSKTGLHCLLCTRTSLFCSVCKNHWPLFHFIDPESSPEHSDLFLSLVHCEVRR